MPKLDPVASSFASRLGVFILAAFGVMMIPVVVRSIARMRVEGDLSQDVVTGLAILAAISGTMMLVSAIYGLWFALFGRDVTGE